MKNLKTQLISFSLVLLLIGCSKNGNPLDSTTRNDVGLADASANHAYPECTPGYEDPDLTDDILSKPDNPGDVRTDFAQIKNPVGDVVKPESSYPQFNSVVVEFHTSKDRYKGFKCYKGAKFRLPNGSIFEIKEGDLSPPPDHPWGEPVTITMKAEMDPRSNELIFTFGPSGCQFDAPAHVTFKWADLSSPLADLFYIDGNGNYIEHLPDNIEIKNKKMHLYIDHFSRYAVASAE